MQVERNKMMMMLPSFSNNRDFSTFPRFPYTGGGRSDKNDHEFPFLRIVELFERSLSNGCRVQLNFKGCLR